jgi:NTP pyrophosphatase (non-canonical NTP hydrolase)
MSKTLDELQDEIGAWGDATFPKSTDQTVLAHFAEEANEFLAAASAMPHNPQYDETEEAADVLRLLLHFAHKTGFSLSDAAERKMVKNRERTWNT